MTDWKALESKYFFNNFRRPPVVFVKGQGMRVWDEDGTEYLDFVGGIAVNVLGHCHPAVTGAICDQAQQLIHTSSLYYTVPQVKLAQLLVENSALDRVFYCNSGAEANEAAIKLVRKYGKMRKNGAYEVISADKSFHGRTLATIAATGNRHYQEPFEPMPVGFRNVPYNSIDAIKSATTDKTIAVLLEVIQGEGGINIPDPDYLPAVRNWCDENGMLLVFDEVQTGMGRTGSLFAYQQAGVEPDVMTLAKGLAGGVPIGVMMGKEKVSVFVPGDHASTFGGNPLACAAGYSVLKYMLDNKVPEHAKEIGEVLKAGLSELQARHRVITDVRGRGCLVGAQLDGDKAADISVRCLKEGLLVNPVQANVLRFAPALIVNEADIKLALGILDRVLSQ